MALSDLTITARAFLQWGATKDLTGLNDSAHEQSVTKTVSTTFGTGADQCNQIYAAVRTLNASTTEDLDLSGTALTNPLGESIAFATVKIVFVWLLSASDVEPGDGTTAGTAASAIVIGGDAASPALWFGNINDTITVKNGGFFFYAFGGTGYTITNSTADVFQVANSDGAVQAKYFLGIAGTA